MGPDEAVELMRQLQDEFRGIQSRLRKTVLLVTHDMAEAMALADRIGVLDGGRLVWCGPAEAIVDPPGDPYQALRCSHGRWNDAHGPPFTRGNTLTAALGAFGVAARAG